MAKKVSPRFKKDLNPLIFTVASSSRTNLDHDDGPVGHLGDVAGLFTAGDVDELRDMAGPGVQFSRH